MHPSSAAISFFTSGDTMIFLMFFFTSMDCLFVEYCDNSFDTCPLLIEQGGQPVGRLDHVIIHNYFEVLRESRYFNHHSSGHIRRSSRPESSATRGYKSSFWPAHLPRRGCGPRSSRPTSPTSRCAMPCEGKPRKPSSAESFSGTKHCA